MLEAFTKKIEGMEQKATDAVTRKFDPDRKMDAQKVFNDVKPNSKEIDPDQRIDIKSNEIKGNGIKNKLDGVAREEAAEKDLQKQYPEKKGYQIIRESYLRNKDGGIVKDGLTGKARRIDFIVAKEGKVVDMIEVTSKTAPKVDQLSKEYRIRENGGDYVKGNNGELIRVPQNIETRVDRRK